MRGIADEVTCFSEERPISTFLGSTDRKGYTIRTRCVWLDESVECYTDFQPFNDSEEVRKQIEEIEKEGKYKFAKQIYEKYFA